MLCPPGGTKGLVQIRDKVAGLKAQEATSVGDRADEIVAQGMTALARSTIIHQASIGPNFDTARGLDNRPVHLESGRIVRCPADAGRDRREGRLVRAGGMPDATGTVRKRNGLASRY
jgi:hypothetical protein